MPTDPLPPLTAAEIAELERLEQAATPGPWMAIQAKGLESPEAAEAYVMQCIRAGVGPFFIVLCEKSDGPADVLHTGNGPTSEANALFCPAARNAIPRLLAELNRLRAALRCADCDEEGMLWAFGTAPKTVCPCGRRALMETLRGRGFQETQE